MDHPNFPIIILAAGAARRMRGRDKLLEDVQGMPLLRQVAIKARMVTRGIVRVALPPAPHARYAALDGLDVEIIAVPNADEGMNASLRTAFSALPADTEYAMLMLADMPDLTVADLAKVAGAVDLSTDTLVWRGATTDGKPGHPIIFHRDLFADFANISGDSGGRDVIAKAQGRVTLVPLADDRARLDLDTPEAWASWRAQNA